MPRRRSLNRKRPLTNGDLGLRFERASGDSDNLKWYNLANLTGVDIDYGNMVMSAGDWPVFDGVNDHSGSGQGLASPGVLNGNYSNFATNPISAYTDLGGGYFTASRCFEAAFRPSNLTGFKKWMGWNYNVVIRPNGSTLSMYIHNGSFGWDISMGSTLELNKWTHIAVNWVITNASPGGYAIVYKDGVEVGDTKGQTKTITGITAANPGVVTCTGHGLATGNWVTFSGLAAGPWGTMLNGQTLPVSRIDANSFSFGDTSMLGSNYTGTGTITFNVGPHALAVVAQQRAFFLGCDSLKNSFLPGELDTFRAWTRHLTTDEIARNAGIVIGRNG
tara:strand:+ start:132 stop:1130 length:999 start_codon:yes stop_codon:yes gene_type:complete